MPGTLILKSLEIEGFRAFKDLRIERLGRVNLITGRNNVGKSYLLEAVSVYAHRGSPGEIFQLMESRDEIQFRSYIRPRSEGDDLDEQVLNIKHLFHGRRDVHESPPPIKIGPASDPSAALRISVGWMMANGTGGAGDQQLLLPLASLYGVEDERLALVVQLGMQEPEYYPLMQYLARRSAVPRDRKTPIPCILIRADGLEPRDVTVLWDSIALTDLEHEVLTALRIIAPQVDRVTLVGEQGTRSGRTPIARTAKSDMPVPLRSMGEGMNRLLGISLALASARNGILLIDEIESGLHYSVQPDLWRLIFRVANWLNVQVFATTHSWDNIASFQQAAQEDDESEGMLISLRRKEGEPERVTAVLFDEQELAMVTRENIEVR